MLSIDNRSSRRDRRSPRTFSSRKHSVESRRKSSERGFPSRNRSSSSNRSTSKNVLARDRSRRSSPVKNPKVFSNKYFKKLVANQDLNGIRFLLALTLWGEEALSNAIQESSHILSKRAVDLILDFLEANISFDLNDLCASIDMARSGPDLSHEIQKDFQIKGTFLVYAACLGHAEIVDILIRAGARPNLEAADGSTALTLAAMRGHRTVVQTIMRHASTLINKKDKDGNSALMLAAYWGHSEMVTDILDFQDVGKSESGEAFMDVNAKNRKGRDALMLAAFRGHVEIVRQLMEVRTARINLQDNKGYSALMLGVSANHAPVVKQLFKAPRIDINLQDKRGRTALMLTVFKDHNEMLEMLLKAPNIDPTITDAFGRTALWIACEKNKISAVKLLLDHSEGLAVNMKDLNGHTPLMVSCYQHNHEITDMLLQNEMVDVNIHDSEDRSLLMQVIEWNDLKTLNSLLILNSISVNEQCVKNGKTALLESILKGHEPIIQRLLELEDIDVNLADFSGDTPLMHAVLQGNPVVVEVLLQHDDIDVNHQNGDGQTACMLAVKHNAKESFQLLIEAKGDINIQDASNRTCMTIAREYHYSKMLRVITKKIKEDEKENAWRASIALADFQTLCRSFFTQYTSLSPLVQTSLENMHPSLKVFCEASDITSDYIFEYFTLPDGKYDIEGLKAVLEIVQHAPYENLDKKRDIGGAEIDSIKLELSDIYHDAIGGSDIDKDGSDWDRTQKACDRFLASYQSLSARKKCTLAQRDALYKILSEKNEEEQAKELAKYSASEIRSLVKLLNPSDVRRMSTVLERVMKHDPSISMLKNDPSKSDGPTTPKGTDLGISHDGSDRTKLSSSGSVVKLLSIDSMDVMSYLNHPDAVVTDLSSNKGSVTDVSLESITIESSIQEKDEVHLDVTDARLRSMTIDSSVTSATDNMEHVLIPSTQNAVVTL